MIRHFQRRTNVVVRFVCGELLLEAFLRCIPGRITYLYWSNILSEAQNSEDSIWLNIFKYVTVYWYLMFLLQFLTRWGFSQFHDPILKGRRNQMLTDLIPISSEQDFIHFSIDPKSQAWEGSVPIGLNFIQIWVWSTSCNKCMANHYWSWWIHNIVSIGLLIQQCAHNHWFQAWDFRLFSGFQVFRFLIPLERLILLLQQWALL